MNYDELKLKNQLCFPLYAASRELIKCYREYLEQIGLTYTQYIVMLVLWEERVLNVKALGKRLYLDSGTLTPVLKSLEAKGYVIRTRSSEDERRLMVEVTPEGDALKQRGLTETIRSKTGLVVDAYFSATKIRWVLENVPGAREQAEAGNLCFGTVETWLIWKLTSGRVHVTDYSNASRTMLFNINTLQWDEEILRELEIPSSMLPEVKPSSCVYGHCDPALLGGAIPIAGAAGDQQAALFGQTCFEPGEAKNTYGTGCFLLMNTGSKPVFSQNGLVTTIAWGLNGAVEYALEGSVFSAGSAVQWLRDEMRLIDSADDSAYMAAKVTDTNGCYLVPAFTGLGAPHWDPYARGTIVGLTRGVNKYHVIRATLESIAYQTADILGAMHADAGIALSALNVDGGASANDLLMQMQADIIGTPVQRPVCVESTAMGAAYLAGLAVGYWSGEADVLRNRAIDRVFYPSITLEERERKLKGWAKAVRYAYGWAKDE